MAGRHRIAGPLLTEVQYQSYGEARFSSFSWAFLGRIAAQGLQLAGTLVLGRLLTPADFGVLAAALVVISLGQIFTDLGIGPAVVHTTQLTRGYLETAFWVNAISGLLLSLIAVAASFPLAAWYHMPQLHWLIPLAGLSFTLSLSTVGLAIMERHFRFKAIATADLCSAVCGQLVAIVVAAKTHSVFALGIGPVVTTLTLTLIVFRISGWRPRFAVVIHRVSLVEIRGFAGFLSLANLATFAARNSDDFLLGRVVSAQSLGFYSRSYQLMLLPVAQVAQALSRVLQPAFAGAKEDRQQLQLLHTRAELGAALIGVPSAVALYSLGPSAIPVLLGPQWTPMTHLFQILALSIPCQVIGVVNGSLYTATGNVKRLLATGTVTSLLLVAVFASTVHLGSTAVAIGFTAHSFATLPMSIIPILRKLHISFRPVVLPLVAILAAGGVLLAILTLGPASIGLREASRGRLVFQLIVLVLLAAAMALIVKLRRSGSTRAQLAANSTGTADIVAPAHGAGTEVMATRTSAPPPAAAHTRARRAPSHAAGAPRPIVESTVVEGRSVIVSTSAIDDTGVIELTFDPEGARHV